jgi:L-ribulose-5-phosphate 4-epimerase
VTLAHDFPVVFRAGEHYDQDLALDHLVTVRLSDGAVIDGDLRPSTDTETHRCLHLAFPSVGGVTHTHSTHVVAFAQAQRDIPVLGTTHADTFNGPIPCTPRLTAEQCATVTAMSMCRLFQNTAAFSAMRCAPS